MTNWSHADWGRRRWVSCIMCLSRETLRPNNPIVREHLCRVRDRRIDLILSEHCISPDRIAASCRVNFVGTMLNARPLSQMIYWHVIVLIRNVCATAAVYRARKLVSRCACRVTIVGANAAHVGMQRECTFTCEQIALRSNARRERPGFGIVDTRA